MPNEDRVAGVRKRIQSGVRDHAETTSRQRAVDLANELVAAHNEAAIEAPFQEDAPLTQNFAFIDTDTLHAIRKYTEILEDDLGIDLGHSKFTRIATTAAQLNSLTRVVIAGYILVESADDLDAAAADANSVADIQDKHFEEFYIAIGIFAVECFLFSTPFNYKIAWRTTRYVNNRFLYRLRNVTPRLHRYLMSEVHFAIRELVASALRSVDTFSTYLVAVVVRTIEILQDAPEDLGDLPGVIEHEVAQYRSFVTDAYQLTPPSVDATALVDDILTELNGFLEVSQYDPAQLVTRIERMNSQTY